MVFKADDFRASDHLPVSCVLIKKNKYVTDHGKKVDEAEAQMLTTAIALKKACRFEKIFFPLGK